MKNIVHCYLGLHKFRLFLDTPEICLHSGDSSSVLVQIYSAKYDTFQIRGIIDMILEVIPKACIIGSTTVGEIADGSLKLGEIVLSFTFFQETQLKSLLCKCPVDKEAESGQNMIAEIRKYGNDVAGVLVLATTLTVDVSKIFAQMSAEEITFPVFGGGAGIYDASRRSCVFSENQFLERGMIAIVFISQKLQISIASNFGWHPLGREMTITQSEGMIVKKIDQMKGFDLYHQYLNIQNDEKFFQNVLEFPFLVNRFGHTVARVPFFAHKDDSIEFVADIVEGEKFQIGYGDPESIIQSAQNIQAAVREFQPEAIFLYACICRRFLMQNDVNLETHPFDYIAPTSGFFTYGEFYSVDGKILLQNSTIVIVAMKEGESEPVKQKRLFEEPDYCNIPSDLYSEKHNRIISSLLYFIGKLTSELEVANRELLNISEIDRLTQIGNRMKLDAVLKNELIRTRMLKDYFSIIMVDIDHFKEVNDTYGHISGDHVLIELSDILKCSVRKSDTVGRWGGEEFLLILPVTKLEHAVGLAEKIRVKIEAYEFREIGHLTCSFGVTGYYDLDTQESMVERADEALYHAKKNGRNQVCFIEV